MKTYLALSAGGERAALMLGMVEQLLADAPRNTNYDEIAGISAGALVGTMVAQTPKHDPAAFARNIARMKKYIASDFKPMKQWVHGSRLNAVDAFMFHSSLYKNLDPLMDILYDEAALRKSGRTLIVGAYDRDQCKYVSFNSTDCMDVMKKAIAASASVPVAFPAIKLYGSSFQDGGMRHIIPVEEIAQWAKQDGQKHITLLLAYPLALKQFMDCNVRQSKGMLSEVEKTVTDIMYTHLESDLRELAGIVGVSYEDLTKTPSQTLELGDLTLRLISPDHLRYGSFTSMTPESTMALVSIGKEAAREQGTQ